MSAHQCPSAALSVLRGSELFDEPTDNASRGADRGPAEDPLGGFEGALRFAAIDARRDDVTRHGHSTVMLGTSSVALLNAAFKTDRT